MNNFVQLGKTNQYFLNAIGLIQKFWVPLFILISRIGVDKMITNRFSVIFTQFYPIVIKSSTSEHKNQT